MVGPFCTEVRLTEHGYTRGCVLDAGHDGTHMDDHGATWDPPAVALRRLVAAWGHTHRIAWTGRMWIATDRDRRSRWRTEVEYTPTQLDTALRRHHGHPTGPPAQHTAQHTPERYT